jgi:ribosomal protein L37AE/L43A
VPRTYVVRKIEESDRAKWEGWAQVEEERGDFEAAQGHRDFLRQWEQEKGQEKEELVCPVCQRRWLKLTARGIRPSRVSDSTGLVRGWVPTACRVRRCRQLSSPTSRFPSRLGPTPPKLPWR